MGKIFGAGKSKYLKQLLVGLLVVGLLGIYIIPQQFAFGSEGESYTVRFLNTDGSMISEQTVSFGESAADPGLGAVQPVPGQELQGWDNDHWTYVDRDVDVRPFFIPSMVIDAQAAEEDLLGSAGPPEEEDPDALAPEEDTGDEEPADADFPAVTLTLEMEDGTTITLDAPEGVLPAGVSMSAAAVADPAIEETLQNKAEEEGNALIGYLAYAITLSDEDGEMIQPNGEVVVTIANPDFEQTSVNEKINMYQLPEYAPDSFAVYAVAKTGIPGEDFRIQKTVDGLPLHTWLERHYGGDRGALVSGMEFELYKTTGNNGPLGEKVADGKIDDKGYINFGNVFGDKLILDDGWYAVIENSTGAAANAFRKSGPSYFNVKYEGDRYVIDGEGFDFSGEYYVNYGWVGDKPEIQLYTEFVTGMIWDGYKDTNTAANGQPNVIQYLTLRPSDGSPEKAYLSFCSHVGSAAYAGNYYAPYLLDKATRARILSAFSYIYDSYGSLDSWSENPTYKETVTPEGATRVLAQMAVWYFLPPDNDEYKIREIYVKDGRYASVNAAFQDVIAAVQGGYTGTGYVKDVIYLMDSVNPSDIGNNQPQLVPVFNMFGNWAGTDPIRHALTVDKTAVGKDMNAGQFSFSLYLSNDEAEQLQLLDNKRASGGSSSTMTFDSQIYIDPGDTYYLIKEDVAKDAGGWKQDPATYWVKVSVGMSDGKLVLSSVQYQKKDSDGQAFGEWQNYNPVAKDLSFYNSYGIIQNAELALEGLKTTGGVSMDAGRFEFTVTEGGSAVASGTNDAAGNIKFTPGFSYDRPGLHTYVISENDPGDGWKSDTASKTVYVNVVDNGDGTLTATAYSDSALSEISRIVDLKGFLTFSNSYNAGGAITFAGTKDTGGLETSGGQFTFLVTENGKTVATGSNAAGAEGENSRIVFTEITYAYTDIGIHTYVITENNPGSEWTMQTAGYTVYVDVTDKGDGTLEAKAYNDAGLENDITNDLGGYLTYVNTYMASGSIDLYGMKTANGAALTNGKFSFTVKENGEAVSTGSNDAAGLIKFSTIPYSAAGDHVYVITEDKVTDSGWTGDSSEKTVYVRVTDDRKGNLTAAAYSDSAYSNPIRNIAVYLTFENTYAAKGSITLNGVKSAEGAALSDGQFTFVLTENGSEIASVKNAANGAIRFPAINYTLSDVGTHTYIISESNPGPGWTAKTSPVTVYVKVTDNGDGTLSALPYLKETDVNPVSNLTSVISFVNAYETSGELVLSGIKDTGGVPMEAGQFAFVISEDGVPVVTGTNNAGGVIQFPAIKYTSAGKHIYEVKEAGASGSGWTLDTAVKTIYVDVTDDGSGNLSAAAYSDEGYSAVIANIPSLLTFSNTYKAEGSVTFAGMKNTGEIDMADGQFTFSVTENGTEVATGENKADGSIVFTKISYDYSDAGSVHTYLISENTPGDGWTANTDPIAVYVKVEDNLNGTLRANVYSDAECTKLITSAAQLTFVNEYETQGSLTLTGTKTANTSVLTESFGFTVYEGDKEVAWGSNNGSLITFTDILYDKAGKHTYVIKEDASSAAGWTIDPSAKTIYVDVVDNGEGVLTASVYGNSDYTDEIENIAQTLTFNNTYSAKGSLAMTGLKTVNRGAPAIPFAFEVTEDGVPVTTGSVTGAGDIVFGTIEYSYADIGNHAYTISEKAPGAGWTANTGTIQIFVKVSDNGDGGLTAALYSDSTYSNEITDAIAIKSLLTFSNTYRAEGQITFGAAKEAIGGAMTDGQFSFAITDVTGGSETSIADGTNTAAGVVSFAPDTLTYRLDESVNQTGRYIYRIEEIVGSGFPEGWKADTNAKLVYVEVTDNGDGTLSAAAYENADYTSEIGNIEEYLTFINSYNAAGDLELKGVKTVTGADTMEAGQFSFTVTEITADGESIVATGTNDEDGNIIFDTISYTLADTGHHEYVISENDPGENWKPGTAPITVYADVADNGDGTLTAALYDTYTDENYSGEISDLAAVLAFDNTFTPVTQLIIEKALGADTNPDGINDNSEFRVRIRNEATGNYLTFAFFPDAVPPTYVYTGEVTVSEENDNIDPDTEITISAAGPALLSGIPAGLTLTVEELDAEVFGWVLETEVNYPDGGDNAVIAAPVYTGEEPSDEMTEEPAEAVQAPEPQTVTVVNSYQTIAISVEVDIDTIRRTSAAFDGTDANVTLNDVPVDNVTLENYRYDINFRSTSNVDVDEFVVDDPLEAVAQGLIRIEGLWTPTVWGDMDGVMNVWYKSNDGSGISAAPAAQVTDVADPVFPTDQSEWKLWRTVVQPDFNIDTQPLIERVRLNVGELGLADDDYITALRFEYGAVKKGFTSCNSVVTQSNQTSDDSSIRNTNGVDAYYDGTIAPLAEPAVSGDTVQAQAALIAPLQVFRSLFSSFTAYAADIPFVTQQSSPAADIPGKGVSANWTPDPGRSDYAAGLSGVSGLKPATYLVSATKPMSDGDIISSVSALIALSLSPNNQSAAGLRLYDKDQDAVLTRVITPFKTSFTEDGFGSVEQMGSFLNIPRFAGMSFVNGEWVDGNGNHVVPRTGDVFALNLWIIISLGMVACIGLLILTFITKKRKKGQDDDGVQENTEGGAVK